ncbi:MAG: alpha/beta hydrolase-fold protein [Anaerolineae bacterium]|nr:alpha/beta hydrolase-fold protein [Anaerolineae bacterium]
MRVWNVRALTLALVVAVLAAGCDSSPAAPTATSPAPVQGEVVSYSAVACGDTITDECDRRIESEILGQKRNVSVSPAARLRPGGGDPYPLLVYFHGWGDNEALATNLVVPALERAIASGDLPPVVAAMPNVSIGGTGVDFPETDYDDSKGTWFINSNLGRYEDFLAEELFPWLRATLNVRQDAAGTALMGESHGGFGAVFTALQHPAISQTVAVFYPTLDFRYSCDGDPLADYDPTCYQRLEEDRPEMTISTDGRLTLERLYYTPFNSDTRPGPTWDEDLPTWQRFSAVNPVELVADEARDLAGYRFFMVAGDSDALNYDAHLMAFLDVAEARGLAVAPAGDNRRTGGHEAAFVEANIDEALRWIGAQLGEAAQ